MNKFLEAAREAENKYEREFSRKIKSGKVISRAITKEEKQYIKSVGGCPQHGLNNFIKGGQQIYLCSAKDGDSVCCYTLSDQTVLKNSKKKLCKIQGCPELTGGGTMCYTHQIEYNRNATKLSNIRSPRKKRLSKKLKWVFEGVHISRRAKFYVQRIKRKS